MESVFKNLYDLILQRKDEESDNSYTCYLFGEGLNKILKKVGEESAETIIAAKDGDKELLTGEVCDLIYHLFVMLAQREVPLEDIEAELTKRSLKMGNLKEFKKTDKNT